MTQIVDFGRPKLNGIAPGLVAGQLLGASQLSELFLRRVSPALVNGKAELDEIRGKSIVWNQLVTTSPAEQSNADADTRATDTFYLTAQGETPQALTITTASAVGRHSEIITAAFTASSAGIIISGQAVNTDIASLNNLVAGHKYYFAITVTANDITTAGGYKWKDTMFVDLTLLGLGDLTAAQFEARYPALNYGYNPGIIKNNDADGIESVGFNQWDEEWETGGLDGNGNPVDYNDRFRTKNYIPVIAGASYYGKFPYTQIVHYYDANYGSVSEELWTDGIVKTMPSNVAYIKFYGYDAVVQPTYNYDICINLSDPDRNGTYEPYWKKDIQLKLSAIKVESHNIWDEEWEPGNLDASGNPAATAGYIRSKNFTPVIPGSTYCFHRPSGYSSGRVLYYTEDKSYVDYFDFEVDRLLTMPSDVCFIKFYVAGTTYNHDICINLSDAAFNGLYEPYGEDGVRTVEGLDGVDTAYDSAKGYRLIKRMWEVDLGDLTWTLRDEENHQFSTGINKVLQGQTYSALLSNKYVTRSGVGRIGLSNMEICQNSANSVSTNEVVIRDNAYSDAATFSAAVAGVKLRFVLATPIEYDIIGGLPGKVFDAFAGGSEFVIAPADAETPSAPFIGEFSYPESAVRGIITEEVFKEFLDALGTAMGGTWTMTYDAATKTYSFSFTS